MVTGMINIASRIRVALFILEGARMFASGPVQTLRGKSISETHARRNKPDDRDENFKIKTNSYDTELKVIFSAPR